MTGRRSMFFFLVFEGSCTFNLFSQVSENVGCENVSIGIGPILMYRCVPNFFLFACCTAVRLWNRWGCNTLGARDRQHKMMVLNTCLCCRHHWRLPIKWGLWPVSSSTGGQHIFFFFPICITLYLFLDVVRRRGAWGWVEMKSFSPLQIALDNRESRRPQSKDDVRFFSFLFSNVTSRDERSKANFCRPTWVTEVPLWKCARPPSKTGCLVPGAHVQPVLSLC